MTVKIFISYRHEDAKGEARALKQALERKLEAAEIFMDVDGGIKPGQSYIHVLDERVAGSTAVLALIGPRWLASTDADGNRRLESPTDPVRTEIFGALKRSIPVLPVLLDDTRMPAETDLPDLLRLLQSRQAMRLRHDRFDADVASIVEAIRSQVSQPEPARPKRKGAAWLIAGASALVALMAWGVWKYATGNSGEEFGKFTIILPGGSADSYDLGVANLHILNGHVWGEKFSSKTPAKKWQYHGYINDTHLVVAYRTEHKAATQDPSGFGTYFFSRIALDGKFQFVGEWRGLNCDTSKRPKPWLLQCPAIMVPGEIRSGDELTREQKLVLSRKCTDIVLETVSPNIPFENQDCPRPN